MSTLNKKELLTKSARLDLKTNQNLKNQLEEAATLSGVNLTAFILTAAAEKAREVVQFHSNTILSNTAWSKLNEILENPPKEMTPAMRALHSKEHLYHGDPI